MTSQEAFDVVVEHLKTQKRRAYSTYLGRCVYRSSDGLKCAVGALIRDEDYHRTLESKDVEDLQSLRLPSLSGLSISLLGQLQLAHDRHANWDESGFIGWHNLRSVGIDQGLDVSKIPH